MPPLQPQTYKGNCHCGSFKFSLRISEPTCVTECNCSVCFRKGYKWIFPPRQNLTVEKRGELSEYEVANVVHKVSWCSTSSQNLADESSFVLLVGRGYSLKERWEDMAGKRWVLM